MYNLFCVKPSVQFVKWKGCRFQWVVGFFCMHFTWNMIQWDKQLNAVKTEWIDWKRRHKWERKACEKCAMNISTIECSRIWKVFFAIGPSFGIQSNVYLHLLSSSLYIVFYVPFVRLTYRCDFISALFFLLFSYFLFCILH